MFSSILHCHVCCVQDLDVVVWQGDFALPLALARCVGENSNRFINFLPLNV
jgi:hypothetical protein